MLSNLQQFGVDLVMLLLLLLIMLSGLLMRGDVPRRLTHRVLFATDLVFVQNVIEMRRHVLISNYFVLQGVPH